MECNLPAKPPVATITIRLEHSDVARFCMCDGNKTIPTTCLVAVFSSGRENASIITTVELSVWFSTLESLVLDLKSQMYGGKPSVYAGF